jgi:hypothetical protein
VLDLSKFKKWGQIAEAGTIGRAKRGSRVTGDENRPPHVLFCLVKTGLNVLQRGIRPPGKLSPADRLNSVLVGPLVDWFACCLDVGELILWLSDWLIGLLGNWRVG